MRILISAMAAVLITAVLLPSQATRDPFGFMERERIRSDTAVRIAQQKAQAEIEVARHHAEAEVKTSQTWAGVLPIIVLILVGGALAGVVFYFRGKAYLLQIAYASQHGHPAHLPSVAPFRKLKKYAEATDQKLDVIDGQYYLTNRVNGKKVRALLK